MDDETFGRARIEAEQDTSVSELAKVFLNGFACGESERECLMRKERALRTRIAPFAAADRLPRQEAHERSA